MVLVIGGAYSGKSHFIKQQFNLSDEDFIDGADLTKENICNYSVIDNFNKYVLNLITESLEDENKNESIIIDKVMELLNRNNDIIVEMRESGCGIVPIDRKERMFREVVGRISCSIAKQSEKVYRVVCGLPVRLK